VRIPSFIFRNIQKIEQSYEFYCPKLYKQLFENGMLDWGEAAPIVCFEKKSTKFGNSNEL